MGLMRAALDAMSGVFGAHWKDFNTVPGGLRPTAALFGAGQRSANIAQLTISPGMSNRDRTGRAHPFGELAETGSVDGHTQTGIQA